MPAITTIRWMQIGCLGLGLAMFAGAGAASPPPSYPQWWIDAEVVEAQPPDAETDPGEFAAWMEANYHPANLGQLKNLAAAAKAYLDEALDGAGGAGAAIADLVTGFDDATPDNFAPVNLGQLKAVAEMFYYRLSVAGFDARVSLIAHGYDTDWPYGYPWPPAPPASGEPGYDEATFTAWRAAHYQPANLGQLKLVFSFELPAAYSEDDDGDGLTGAEEYMLGTNPDVADTDGDGVDDDEDDFPMNPALTTIGSSDPGDSTGPVITVLNPANAQEL